MKFSDSISKQILERGISLVEIENQILLFKKGTPPVKLVSSATIGNGISEFSEERNTLFVSDYERESQNLEILKFVPASGSATRMFKFLYNFLANFDPEKEKFDEDHSPWLKFSLTFSTILILLYFIFPSQLVEMVSRINII
jgi:hypothetical protein